MSSTSLSSAGGSLVLPSVRALNQSTCKLSVVLRSRVLTAFLVKYAKLQFSVENLEFLQAVQDFQDQYDERSAEKEAQRIFKDYIDEETAKSQICLTSDEYAKVVELFTVKKKYHENMFDDFLKVPKLTVERDIFPRFLESEFFVEMKNCVEQPFQEYLKNFQTAPSSILSQQNPPDISKDDVRFTFEQVVADSRLSEIFLQELRARHCAENLECLVSIRKYKERHGMTDINPKETQHRAWLIYFSHLQENCEHEISVHSNIRHRIGSHLADDLPPKELFDTLESTLEALIRQQNWPSFCKTDKYAELVKALRAPRAPQSSSCSVM